MATRRKAADETAAENTENTATDESTEAADSGDGATATDTADAKVADTADNPTSSQDAAAITEAQLAAASGGLTPPPVAGITSDPGGTVLAEGYDSEADDGASLSTAPPAPAAGPLVPAEDTKRQPYVTPNQNLPAHAMAAAPFVHNAEAEHIDVVGEDGQSIAPGDMFTEPVGSQTVVYAKQRMFRVFRDRNITRTRKSLLYAKGAPVGLIEVARIHAAMTAAQRGEDAAPIGDGIARGV